MLEVNDAFESSTEWTARSLEFYIVFFSLSFVGAE